MKYLVRFFVIILITFCTTISKSENLLIVYIDMDKVMNETVAGKSIVNQLDKIHKLNIAEFEKIESDLNSRALTLKYAHFNHGSKRLMSSSSTVAPHQILKPGGASR